MLPHLRIYTKRLWLSHVLLLVHAHLIHASLLWIWSLTRVAWLWCPPVSDVYLAAYLTSKRARTLSPSQIPRENHRQSPAYLHYHYCIITSFLRCRLNNVQERKRVNGLFNLSFIDAHVVHMTSHHTCIYASKLAFSCRADRHVGELSLFAASAHKSAHAFTTPVSCYCQVLNEIIN